MREKVLDVRYQSNGTRWSNAIKQESKEKENRASMEAMINAWIDCDLGEY